MPVKSLFRSFGKYPLLWKVQSDESSLPTRMSTHVLHAAECSPSLSSGSFFSCWWTCCVSGPCRWGGVDKGGGLFIPTRLSTPQPSIGSSARVSVAVLSVRAQRIQPPAQWSVTLHLSLTCLSLFFFFCFFCCLSLEFCWEIRAILQRSCSHWTAKVFLVKKAFHSGVFSCHNVYADYLLLHAPTQTAYWAPSRIVIIARLLGWYHLWKPSVWNRRV